MSQQEGVYICSVYPVGLEIHSTACWLPTRLKNSSHPHSHTFRVRPDFPLWKLYSQCSGIIPCASQDFFYSPSWNPVTTSSGKISHFFDRFLSFIFPLFIDCLHVRNFYSISWVSLSTVHPTPNIVIFQQFFLVLILRASCFISLT